jgi:hypothetical protein
MSGVDVPALAAGLLAGGSFVVAGALGSTRGTTTHAAPPPAAPPALRPPAELALRLAATAAIVLALTAAAGPLGAHVGGLLVAFPVLASVLSAFTHARDGGAAAASLLGGMTRGLVGFAGFCLAIALWLPELGVAGGFAAAGATALALHAATLPLARRAAAAAQTAPT